MRRWMIAAIFICLFFPETGSSDIYYFLAKDEERRMVKQYGDF